MKKFTMVIILGMLAVALLATAGIAYAQRPTPQPGQGFGPGFGGHGMGGMMQNRTGEEGPMHDAMMAALAEKLNLSVADLEARHDAGEHMVDIALAQGLTVEEFQAIMQEAHSAAVDQAVADGTITAEQAEWMKQRPMMGGQGRMGRGMMGRGGMMGNGAGTCPHFQDAQTQ